MFNVKENGFLYKFHKFHQTQCSRDLRLGYTVNLCRLFWSTLGHMIADLVMLFTTIPIVGVILYGLVSAFIGIPLLLVGIEIPLLISDFAFTGYIVSFLSGVLLFLWQKEEIEEKGEGTICSKKYPDWMGKYLGEYFSNEIDYSKPYVLKQPSLIVSYYRAFKDKVCPLVKLEKGE